MQLFSCVRVPADRSLNWTLRNVWNFQVDELSPSAETILAELTSPALIDRASKRAKYAQCVIEFRSRSNST